MLMPLLLLLLRLRKGQVIPQERLLIDLSPCLILLLPLEKQEHILVKRVLVAAHWKTHTCS
jgi:hypothetical protein